MGAVGTLLMILFFVLGYGFFVAVQARANRQQILKRVRERVEGVFEAERSGLFHDLVAGRSEGRDLRLRIGTRPKLFPPGSLIYPLTATLELRHAPDVTLRIRFDRGLAAFEKSAGLVRDLEVAGGGKFDRNYLVEAESAPAQTPLADADVRLAVDNLLMRWDLDEIRIQNGRLIARGDSRRLGQNMLRGLLVELNILAHAYDRRPAIELGVKERFFWLGGSDSMPRCPYCHDTIESKVDVSSCGACGTLIHAECFAENCGCPILGCGGRGAMPAGPLKLPE